MLCDKHTQYSEQLNTYFIEVFQRIFKLHDIKFIVNVEVNSVIDNTFLIGETFQRHRMPHLQTCIKACVVADKRRLFLMHLNSIVCTDIDIFSEATHFLPSLFLLPFSAKLHKYICRVLCF